MRPRGRERCEPDSMHHRRRLGEDPGHERGASLAHLGPGLRAVDRKRRGRRAERERRLDRVASVRRVPRQEAIDEPNRLRRRRRRGEREGGGRLVRATEARRQPVFPFERQAAAQHPIEDAAEGVDVRRRAGRVARRLLRRPVLRRPGEHARDRCGA